MKWSSISTGKFLQQGCQKLDNFLAQRKGVVYLLEAFCNKVVKHLTTILCKKKL